MIETMMTDKLTIGLANTVKCAPLDDNNIGLCDKIGCNTKGCSRCRHKLKV